jgi:hypothetical protein
VPRSLPCRMLTSGVVAYVVAIGSSFSGVIP